MLSRSRPPRKWSRPATITGSFAAVLCLLMSVPASAGDDPGAASYFIAAIDSARAGAGLPAYQISGQLDAVAAQHAAAMAAAGYLFHNPSLGSEVSGWTSLGENVGSGPSAVDVNSLFLSSPEHVGNILSSVFNEVGVGAYVDSHGRLWVTEDFMASANGGGGGGVSPPAAPPITSPPVTTATTASQVVTRPAQESPARRLQVRLIWIERHDPRAPANPITQAILYLRDVAVLAGDPTKG